LGSAAPSTSKHRPLRPACPFTESGKPLFSKASYIQKRSTGWPCEAKRPRRSALVSAACCPCGAGCGGSVPVTVPFTTLPGTARPNGSFFPSRRTPGTTRGRVVAEFRRPCLGATAHPGDADHAHFQRGVVTLNGTGYRAGSDEPELEAASGLRRDEATTPGQQQPVGAVFNSLGRRRCGRNCVART